MVLDKVLEKEIKKFDVDTEIKMGFEKYLTPDEKWDIVSKFFQGKSTENMKVICNKINKMIVVDFSSARKAKEFADMPSEGLAAFARQWLREKGEDFKKYDVYFNLAVTYEDKDEKKNKKVIIRVM